MMTIKLETQDIRNISVFERLTKVHARDCISAEDCVYYIVDKGKVGIAIGKNGISVKGVSRALGKAVKVFEFGDNADEMLKSMVPNLKKVENNNGNITITVPSGDKSMVIGKGGKNIKVIKEFLNRHFKINDVRLR